MKKNFRNWLILVTLLLPFASSATDKAHLTPPPKGWRLPSQKELEDKWRDREPSRFATVTGDFDGDKSVDQAMILVSNDGKKFGIFVWFSGGKSVAAAEVFVEKDLSLIHGMGISLYKPSSAKTACGKGYFECTKGDTGELTVTNDSIDYFKEESADSVFHWDAKKKLFLHTWMSD